MATESDGLTVLLVDDDHVTRMGARLALEHATGIRVIEAGSGAEALEAAMRLLPDVVILAAMMHGMDGPDVLRALRDNPLTSRLPVIFLTAGTTAGELERLRSLGALAVIPTPVDPASLTTRLRDALAGRPAADASGAAAAAPLISGLDIDIDVDALLRLQGLTGETGGDLVVELVELFATTTPSALRSLREQADTDRISSREAVRIGHTLKSSASTVGATAIADLARTIEVLASEGRVDEIVPIVDHIEAVLEATLERLRVECSRLRRGG